VCAHRRLSVSEALVVGVGQQDVHQAQPGGLAAGLVQQVGAGGEAPHLVLVVVREAYICTG
jgi:hypothetical protein